MRLRNIFHLFLFILSLFPKNALAIPWPLAPQNQTHQIWQSYGQYQESGGIHFYEGIDLKVPQGTEVRAVANGKIARIYERSIPL